MVCSLQYQGFVESGWSRAQAGLLGLADERAAGPSPGG
jgi:hypothetical protein